MWLVRTVSPLGLTIIPTGSTPPTPGGLPPAPSVYPASVPGPGGLNVELKTEPLSYSGDSSGPPGHNMPGEAMMAGAYTGAEGGYGGYHGGYEEAAARHGAGAWPGYQHHHHASLAHTQGSPTQRYPYYDSRYGTM